MIKFGDNKKKQTRKLVEYKDFIVDIANTPVIKKNNCLLFKNNRKYA